jgi:hypothetical protein
MNITEGEYWVFSAECLHGVKGVPGEPVADYAGELVPQICMRCDLCEMTMVPDAILFTPEGE